jgi:hypothetical protein
MDPDAVLIRLRELAQLILSPENEQADITDTAEELAVEFNHLDKWFMRGGFLPNEWERAAG